MTQGQRAQEVFKRELALIDDEAIRSFVVSVFDKFGVDDWWDRPCSLSGKYHPSISQGKGGLVRHVKYAVWWGDELCRSFFNSTGKDGDRGMIRDVIIAALILHDLMKDGDPELASLPERRGRSAHRLITGCHGVDLANAINERLLNGKPSPEQVLICYGIAAHMGPWTIPDAYRPENAPEGLARTVAWAVHTADYAASRKADEEMSRLASDGAAAA